MLFRSKRLDVELSAAEARYDQRVAAGKARAASAQRDNSGRLTDAERALVKHPADAERESSELPPPPPLPPELTSTSPNTKTKAPQRTEKPPDLPDWLPLDAWHDWLAMRTRIRKPATARAQRMALGNLEQLREAGEDPNQVICKAINKCWLEFWPLERPK